MDAADVSLQIITMTNKGERKRDAQGGGTSTSRRAWSALPGSSGADMAVVDMGVHIPRSGVPTGCMRRCGLSKRTSTVRHQPCKQQQQQKKEAKKEREKRKKPERKKARKRKKEKRGGGSRKRKRKKRDAEGDGETKVKEQQQKKNSWGRE